MKEIEFLNVIHKTLSDPSFLGNDCAFIEDLGLCITQDTLVEDVHFTLKTTSPYFLGRKAISINLSDIAAGLSVQKYVLVSLSMPCHIEYHFVEELYKGINSVCEEYNIKVIGGDITGGDKIVISVCAIGKKEIPYKVSRSYAKTGNLIVTTGYYGSSSIGLYALKNNICILQEIIDTHTNPTPKIKESLVLSHSINKDTAVMDTSDGLIDAVYKISQSSKHNIEIDFDKIPIDIRVLKFVKKNNIDLEKYVLWGGEDYELIAAIDEETYDKLPKNMFKIIGTVKEQAKTPMVILNKENKKIIIDKDVFESNSFNHFE